MRAITALALSLATLIVGCNSADTSPASTQPVESQTLRKEYEAALASASVKTPQNLSAIRAESDIAAAVALKVTPAEETRFAAGKFDDAKNQKRVGQAIYLLQDLGAHLDPATAILNRSYSKDKPPPTGAKLELLARLLEYHVDYWKKNPAMKK